MSTIEETLGEKEVITSADIRKELFEGENIRTASMDNAADEFKKRAHRDNAKNTKISKKDE